MSLQEKEAKPLGSVSAWGLFRYVFPGSYIPIALLGTTLPEGIPFMLMFFAVAWIRNYAHAYGYADEDGITFRRFFRKHRVSWDDVSRVDWSISNLLRRAYVEGTRESKVGFFRKVKFMVSDKSYRWGQPPREDWVPKILPWIMNQPRMNQPSTR